MGGPAVINGKEYPEFDNFYEAPIIVKFSYGECTYECKTVEHAFQAYKTDDAQEREKIIEAKNAFLAREYGQDVTLVGDWENVKVERMRHLVNLKLLRYPDILEKLLATKEHNIYFHGSSKFWNEQNQKIWEYWRTYYRRRNGNN